MTRKKNTNAPAAYEVGRGKPPRSAQFKPGQSGNPGGRKKGSRNIKTILFEVLDNEIEITEGGRTRRIPLIQALMLRQAQEGLRGQWRATDSLLDRFERYADHEPEQGAELPEEDRVLLEEALGSARKRCGSDPPRPPGDPGMAVGEDRDHD